MKRYLIPLLAVGTAVMIYIMMKTGGPLNTPVTPHGIVNLELAYDKAHVDAVLTAWQPGDKINAAITNTYWDFLFIFFYALFLFCVCKKLSEKFTTGSWKYKAGRFFARAIVLAGLLDAGENFGMLQALKGGGSETVAMVTTSCSAVKWLLVMFTIIYVLVALVLKKQTVK